MLENYNYVADCLNQHLPTDKRNCIVVTSLIRRRGDKTVCFCTIGEKGENKRYKLDTSNKRLIRKLPNDNLEDHEGLREPGIVFFFNIVRINIALFFQQPMYKF